MSTGNDELFENIVNDFAKVEADENKNVDEQVKEETKKGKFYPEDLEAGRRENIERMERAKAQDKIPVLAEYQILTLMDTAERGLPDVYDSFEDFLYDFWSDFNWIPKKRNPEIQAVLDDPRFKKIVPILKDTWGVDMEDDLKKGLEEESQEASEGKNPKSTDDEKTRTKKLKEWEEGEDFENLEDALDALMEYSGDYMDREVGVTKAYKEEIGSMLKKMKDQFGFNKVVHSLKVAISNTEGVDIAEIRFWAKTLGVKTGSLIESKSKPQENKKVNEQKDNPYELLYEEDPIDPQSPLVEKERKEVEKAITKVLKDAAKSIQEIKNGKKYGVGDIATDKAITEIFYDLFHQEV